MRIEVKPHERYGIWRDAIFDVECWLIVGVKKYSAEVWHEGRRIRHGKPGVVVNDNRWGNSKIDCAVQSFRKARLFVREMEK